MIPRYSRPQMVAIWEPQMRFRIWFEIEAHACDALAEIGVIPKESAKAIWEKAGNVTFDVARIDEAQVSVTVWEQYDKPDSKKKYIADFNNIRIDKDGRWELAAQPPTLVSAADVIQSGAGRVRLDPNVAGARRWPGKAAVILHRQSGRELEGLKQSGAGRQRRQKAGAERDGYWAASSSLTAWRSLAMSKGF